MREFGLTHEEYEMVNKVAKALDMNPERVVHTPYMALIKMLVAKIELKDALIESIEKFIERCINDSRNKTKE